MRRNFAALARRPILLLVIGTALAALPVATPEARAAWPLDGLPICTQPSNQGSVAIVSNFASGAIIAWADARATVEDVYCRGVDSTGALMWGGEVGLCLQPGPQNVPVGVSDGAGGGIFAWNDFRNGSTADLYAQRVSASGVPQWTADGVVICVQNGSQQSLSLAPDGFVSAITLPGAFAAWADNRGSDADIYAQHIATSGATTWAANGLAVCTLGAGQTNPVICSDGQGAPDVLGGALVVWGDGRTPANGVDLYMQRVDGAGVPQWTAGGIPLCSEVAGQFSARIVAAAGANIVTWSDQRVNPWQIYAQRVSVAGSVRWGVNGKVVAAGAGLQGNPSIVPMSDGGAVIAWEDSRLGTVDVWMQRIDSTGAEVWQAGGIPVCTAAGAQLRPQLVRGIDDALMVSWIDNRGGSANGVYAQGLSASGAISWAPGGIPVRALASGVNAHRMVTDGGLGAIIAWDDLRAGVSDVNVYASRISPPGMVGVGPSGPGRLAFALRSPNPGRGEARWALELPAESEVRVHAYDVSGRRVATIAEARLTAGPHELVWDGRRVDGRVAAPGIYLVRAEAGGRRAQLKLVRVR